METRIALIGIIVEDMRAADRLNAILHEFAGCIVGRMGIPYHAKDVSIISVVVDAPNNVISSLSGKLGDASRRQHQDGLFQGRRSPA